MGGPKVVGPLTVATEVAPEVLGGGIPVDRVLGQQLEGDGLQRLGHRRPGSPQRLGAVLDVPIGDGHRGLPGERWTPQEHLVEHDAQRIKVAPRVNWPALSLLGREVGGRTHDGTGLGEVVASSDKGRGDAEVSHLDLAVRRYQHVPRLDVTVNQAVAVGESQGGRDVGRDVGRPIRMDATLGAEHLGQTPALHVLHHDEVGALLLTPVVHADDVGMVEVGRRLGLPTEALHEAGIARELIEQDLDRHRTIQQQVARQIHVGHTAAGDLPVELVPLVKDGGTHCGHGDQFYRSSDSCGRRSGSIHGPPEAFDQTSGLV